MNRPTIFILSLVAWCSWTAFANGQTIQGLTTNQDSTVLVQALPLPPLDLSTFLAAESLSELLCPNADHPTAVAQAIQHPLTSIGQDLLVSLKQQKALWGLQGLSQYQWKNPTSGSGFAAPLKAYQRDVLQLFLLFQRAQLSASEQHFCSQHKTKNKLFKVSKSDLQALRQLEQQAKQQWLKGKEAMLGAAILTCGQLLRQHPRKALEYSQRTKKLNLNRPNPPTLHRLQALAYFQLKKYTTAQQCLSKIPAPAWRASDAYFFGLLAYLQNNQPSANAHFAHALQLDPHYYPAACAQISILVQNGQFEAASKQLKTYPLAQRELVQQQHLHYFNAALSLFNEDRNSSFRRLKAVHAQSCYLPYQKQLLEHFFAQPTH